MLGMAKADELVIPSKEAIQCVAENPDSDNYNTSEQSWKPGQLEFEAEMRSLDYAVFIYKLSSLNIQREDNYFVII